MATMVEQVRGGSLEQRGIRSRGQGYYGGTGVCVERGLVHWVGEGREQAGVMGQREPTE